MDGKTLFSSVGVLAIVVVGIVAFHNQVSSDDRTFTINEAADTEVDPDGDVVREASLEDVRNELRGLRTDVQRVLAWLGGKPLPVGKAAPTAADSAEQVAVITVEFVQAESVAEVIQNVLPDVRVSVLNEENRVVLVADLEKMAQAMQTIRSMDQPRQQVHIESYLFEVPVDAVAELGLDAKNGLQTIVTNLPGKPAGLEPLINAIQQAEGARLLARPNIRAYDRVAATFQSVQEIPVQSITQTEVGSIGTTEFREVGISLEVTPHVTTSGIIMEVHPEFSVMRGYVDNQPIIDRRSATTTIKVKDGEPILISGLRSRNQPVEDNSIGEPANTETELVIIVKAEIIDSGNAE